MNKGFLLAAIITPVVFLGAVEDDAHHHQEATKGPQVPEVVNQEHAELHKKLSRIIAGGGGTAEAAKKVADVLHAHFVKEEKYALPPLGLLAALAEGKPVASAQDIIAMTDKLKAELPEMIKEHGQVIQALHELEERAQEEGNSEAVKFADELTLHAQTEEQILYPAAILVGEYLKLKLGH